MDCSVGPGVGCGLITVHPEGMLEVSVEAFVGVEGALVGRDALEVVGISASLVVRFVISVPGDCVLIFPWQLMIISVKDTNKRVIRFKFFLPGILIRFLRA